VITTLRRQGRGQVLPIDQATMDAMGIDQDTPLQVTVTGNTLVVTPVPMGVPKAQLKRSLAKMRERYGQTLRNLAAGPGDE
jgi:antitoxin component of MazEF toxin-antitoxin module